MKRLRLATQMQSLAMAMLKKSRSPITSAELVSHPEAVRLTANPAHATSALEALYRIGSCQRVRMGHGRHKWGYELPMETRPTAPSQPSPALPPDVKITVVKGERLRLTFKGINIDIGVEP